MSHLCSHYMYNRLLCSRSRDDQNTVRTVGNGFSAVCSKDLLHHHLDRNIIMSTRMIYVERQI